MLKVHPSRSSRPRPRRLPSRSRTPLQPPTNPAQAAQAAGLRYVSDGAAGIRRLRAGRGFRYVDARGEPVRDHATLARIRSLVIPPAWRDVWICADPRGHLQATGRDAKGRKQSRYHPLWRAVRDDTKYERMVAFGEALPTLRQQLARDLARSDFNREKVLATVLRLLDLTAIRVGNEEYARDNQSYGLTTLRNEHVEVHGTEVRFQFRGKSGKEHCVSVRDPRLARIVSRCQELPGHLLFEYRDAEGQVRGVDSADVNERLRELTGTEFTAKDFRTWVGTVLTARALGELGVADCATRAKANVAGAIQVAARQLGNTPAVCRKSYVHPGVIAAYLDGRLVACPPEVVGVPPNAPASQPPPDGLSADEAAVLALLGGLDERGAQEAATAG